MTSRSELAYAIDPPTWVKRTLGVEPMDWQSQFLYAPRGASIIVLTARQVGKTTAEVKKTRRIRTRVPRRRAVVDRSNGA